MRNLERQAGTYLYGRRMYEVMVGWENSEDFVGQPGYIREFAQIWQAADKIVYSTTLQAPSTARTRIERGFDPGAVRQIKDLANRDLVVGGHNLAAQAIAAGLVDEYCLFFAPTVVGGGKRFLPDHVRFGLELLDEHGFSNGMVYLRLCSRMHR